MNTHFRCNTLCNFIQSERCRFMHWRAIDCSTYRQRCAGNGWFQRRECLFNPLLFGWKIDARVNSDLRTGRHNVFARASSCNRWSNGCANFWVRNCGNGLHLCSKFHECVNSFFRFQACMACATNNVDSKCAHAFTRDLQRIIVATWLKHQNISRRQCACLNEFA